MPGGKRLLGMKVRSYPGRAVLEDPELLVDPDATRGRAMELLYEASWRECGVNWTNGSRVTSRSPPGVEDGQTDYQHSDCDRSPRDSRSQRSSSSTTDSESSDINQNHEQGGFLIPRPRLIVPVHTYARRRRTGAPAPIRRRHREGTTSYFVSSL